MPLSPSPPHGLVPGARVLVRDEAWIVERLRPVGDGDADALVDLAPPAGRAAACTLVAAVEDITPAPARVRRASRRHARRTWLALRTEACAPCRPLAPVHLDIDIVDYQLAPLVALLGGEVSRVLVADAVGLGKTIEAGLAVREAWLRRGRLRALVVCPSMLVAQWIGELRGKLAVDAEVCDAGWLARQAAALPHGTSPWTLEGCRIASFDFIKQPHVLHGATGVAWDVVVIDEAHHATRPTFRRSAADALGRAAEWLLLLTATPHDGRDDTASRLLATGRLAAHDPIMCFHRTREQLRLARGRRTHTLMLGPSAATAHLFAVLEQYLSVVLPATAGGAVELLAGILRRRARSSAAAFVRTVSRRLELLEARHRAAPVVTQLALFDESASCADEEERDEIVGTTSPTPWPRERAWLSRLRLAGVTAARDDRKIARLADLLRRAAPDAAVVFTEYRDTLSACWLGLAGRVPLVAMSGAMAPADRASALRAFLDGSARVLLTTDIGAEGLNLHERARLVVHLDVPWSPRRVEQRAGRVDRFGQTRTVHVMTMVYRERVDRAQYGRLLERAEAADSAMDPGRADGPVTAQGEQLRPSPALERAAALAAADLEQQRRARRQWQREGRGGGVDAAAIPHFAGRRRAPGGRDVAVVQTTVRRTDGYLVARTLSCEPVDQPVPRPRWTAMPGPEPPRRAALAASLRKRARAGARQPSLFGFEDAPPSGAVTPDAHVQALLVDSDTRLVVRVPYAPR